MLAWPFLGVAHLIREGAVPQQPRQQPHKQVVADIHAYIWSVHVVMHRLQPRLDFAPDAHTEQASTCPQNPPQKQQQKTQHGASTKLMAMQTRTMSRHDPWSKTAATVHIGSSIFASKRHDESFITAIGEPGQSRSRRAGPESESESESRGRSRSRRAGAGVGEPGPESESRGRSRRAGAGVGEPGPESESRDWSPVPCLLTCPLCPPSKHRAGVGKDRTRV